MISAKDLHEKHFGKAVINEHLQKIEKLLEDAGNKGERCCKYTVHVAHSDAVGNELETLGYRVSKVITGSYSCLDIRF